MRPVFQILASATTLTGWIDRQRVEQRLEARVRDLLPKALGTHVAVGDGRPPMLVLVAASGAAATMLLHRAPELLEGLRSDGFQFTGIKVRVQVRSAPGRSNKVMQDHRDKPNASALLAVAAGISDPALRAALRRLAGHVDDGPQSVAGEKHPLDRVEDQNPEQ